jgi:hypothetical protein
VIAFCEACFQFAVAFYKRAKMHGPLQVRVSVGNIQRIALDPRPPRAFDPFDALWYGGYAQDPTIGLYEAEHSARSLGDMVDSVLRDLASNLIWAFGYPFKREEIDALVAKLLSQ